MRFLRNMTLLVVAFGSSSCAVVAAEDGERVDEAEQATVAQYTAGHYAGWTAGPVTYQLHGGSQYYDSVEVDDVLGYSFTVQVTVSFTGSYTLGSWTTTNQNLCRQEHAWIYLSKNLNGSWVSWVTGADYYAEPVRVGNQVGDCQVTFSHTATFGSSTALNAYVDALNANGTYTIESITITEN